MRWVITALFLLTFIAAIEGPLHPIVAYRDQAELTRIEHNHYVSVAISTYLSLGIFVACGALMTRAGDLAPSLFAVGLLNFLILAVDVPWMLGH